MPPKSKDIGWEHGVAYGGNTRKVVCNYCDKIVSGGITRFKEHLGGVTGNVEPCRNASRELAKMMRDHLKEGAEKRDMENKKKAQLLESLRDETQFYQYDPHSIDDDDDDDDDDNMTRLEREQLRQGMRQSRRSAQMDEEQRRRSVVHTKGESWAAKQMALGDIFGTWEGSYEELPRYLEAVKQANPGTRTHLLANDSNMAGANIFQSVFWSFGPAIEAFKHCRPVICVDGTFLTGKYKGVMLIAVSQDGENQILPIAFAIVEKENQENWGWFLSCLRYYVTNRRGLCLISDRHAGLLSYIQSDDQWKPPFAYHRYCARHLGSNFTKRYNKTVGDQVKMVALQIQLRKFEAELEKTLRFANGDVHKELERLDLRKWSFAHDGGRRYGAMTTNVSEIFNGVIKEARHLPITATVMTTFYKSVTYFNDKVVKARASKVAGHVFSNFALKKYDAWRSTSRGHTVIEFDRDTRMYEVQTPVNRTSPYRGSHKHTVNLGAPTCTCNKMKQWRIPCSHVIAVCSRMGIDPTQYIDDIWKLDSIIAMYTSERFVPLVDNCYWPPYDGPIILPDEERIRGRGRPKVNRIRNEMDLIEAQPSKKQSCRLCGGQGHNKRKCPRLTGEGSSGTINM